MISICVVNVLCFSFVVFLTVLIMLLLKVKDFVSIKTRFLLYQNYDDINKVLKESKDLAYDKIFKEYVITELSEGTKLNSEQIDSLVREYLKLVFQFLGDKVSSDLVALYGDDSNLMSILTYEFVSRIVNEELEHYSKQAENYFSSK